MRASVRVRCGVRVRVTASVRVTARARVTVRVLRAFESLPFSLFSLSSPCVCQPKNFLFFNLNIHNVSRLFSFCSNTRIPMRYSILHFIGCSMQLRCCTQPKNELSLVQSCHLFIPRGLFCLPHILFLEERPIFVACCISFLKEPYSIFKK